MYIYMYIYTYSVCVIRLVRECTVCVCVYDIKSEYLAKTMPSVSTFQ